DDDAIADQAPLARVEHARRHQVEHDRVVAAADAVPGVRAALVSGDDVGLLGQTIDDLSLALVAPLGAHDHRARHATALRGSSAQTLKVRNASTTRSAASTPARSCASAVEAPRCGVAITFGSSSSGVTPAGPPPTRPAAHR